MICLETIVKGVPVPVTVRLPIPVTVADWKLFCECTDESVQNGTVIDN